MAVEKLNEANALIKIEVSNSVIDAKKEQVAKKMAKEVKVDGFRKGKVPVSVIKKMYADTIEKTAIDELIKEEYEAGMKELNIKQDDIMGEPIFTKFERGEENTEIEIKVSLKPTFDIEGYDEAIPEVELPKISKEEIEAKIAEYAKNSAEPQDSEKEVVDNGDIAVIDFEGYIDGEKMENGSATNYPLELGSNSFIPGFEEQIVGMKVGEEKEINVTFPKEYGAKEIAGKDAVFKVKLNKIQEKVVPEVTDELAKKLLQLEEATIETLNEEIEKELLNSKKVAIFTPKKEELAENLISKFDFDLPDSVVDKETEMVINQKASTMSEDEIKELTSNQEKLKEFQDEARKEAEKKVKLTFIVDELAKKEGIEVSDQEVLQVIYFEAIRAGENAEKVYEYYKKNNLLPAVKMTMVEDKLFNTLLDKKAK